MIDDAMRGLLEDVRRALEAWDTSPLPKGRDGMLQERIECLRAAFLAVLIEK